MQLVLSAAGGINMQLQAEVSLSVHNLCHWHDLLHRVIFHVISCLFKVHICLLKWWGQGKFFIFEC